MKKILVGIVVVFMLTTMVSASTTTYKLNKKAVETTGIQMASDLVTPNIKKLPLTPQRNPQRGPNFQSNFVGTDVQISSSAQIEGHPSITIDHDGNPIVVYDYRTSEGHSEIFLQRSPDGGETWPSDQKYYVVGDEELSMINPVIELYDNGTRGGIIIQQENQPDPNAYIIDLVDIDDPESWILVPFDQSNVTSWIGETSGAIFGTHTATWSYIGDVIFDEYNETETLNIAWTTDPDDPEAYAALFFFADENTYYSHPTSAAGLNLYGAAQRNTQSGSRIQIAWAPWEDPVFENWDYATVGATSSNTTYPKLAASGEYAYLVVQDDENGNQDINCYTPGIVMWTKHTVVNSEEDEMYPSITAFGEIAICTFVKNGDLYMSRSEDAGVTWGEAVQINDENNELIEEYRCADITGPYIIWMDNRSGNADIYMDTTELPWVVITEFNGGLGVSGTVLNVGTEDASEVPWELFIKGGILGLINKTYNGTTDILQGEIVSIETGFFFGLGPIKIVLIVDGAARDTEALQLIVLTLI